ncbi:MAG: hypothetical protein GF329_17375 [Candidatus Lokiarchaeota archaeon]|nr:hypothetical protein [Candidatus Lokiarchaeota archaeon]
MPKKFFGIRLEKETLDKIEEFSRNEGLLPSAYVRKIINEDIKKKDYLHFESIYVGASEYDKMIETLLKTSKNDILLYSKSCTNYFLWNIGKSEKDMTHDQIIKYIKEYFMFLDCFITDIQFKKDNNKFRFNFDFKNNNFAQWHGEDIIQFFRNSEKFEIEEIQFVERNLIVILNPI